MAETVVRRIELWEIHRAPPERVDVRDAMTARAIRMDQPQRARVLLGVAAVERGGRCAGAKDRSPGRIDTDRQRIDLVRPATVPATVDRQRHNRRGGDRHPGAVEYLDSP